MMATDDSARQQAQEVNASKTLPLMSRDEIEDLIANGRHIVIYREYVLKLDAWLNYHPGGAKSIMHLVGRDGTDWVDVYVNHVSGTHACIGHTANASFLQSAFRRGKTENAAVPHRTN